MCTNLTGKAYSVQYCQCLNEGKKDRLWVIKTSIYSRTHEICLVDGERGIERDAAARHQHLAGFVVHQTVAVRRVGEVAQPEAEYIEGLVTTHNRETPAGPAWPGRWIGRPYRFK